LRILRRQAQLTQGQLAQQLGLVAHVHISLLERGRKLPSPELFVQIADILGVTTDNLLSDSSDTPVE
jgi:transcriptional regulator with XRE-family HTH domain